MFQIVKKLKLLKKELKMLNTQFFRNLVAEANNDRMTLHLAQNKQQADPMNMTLQREEKEKIFKFKNTSHMEEMFLQLKSKENWSKLGNDNTKYFYFVIKHRRLKYATTQLRDENGVWKHDLATISSLFVKHYEEMLGRKCETGRKTFEGFFQNGHTLTIQQHIVIIHPFAEKDIKHATFKIDSNKSPGPAMGVGF
ncbi:uncharacterized protein LOC129883629 [Solanum dulcamara]|uniref:uncharacterized protein LOC129883629 n=1 Tax=Solanum dulcamara TaxID=45834 RepID=UPI002484FB4B|nr:uncharacterized protein LOC129883629 [Solanum dulcamara]